MEKNFILIRLVLICANHMSKKIMIDLAAVGYAPVINMTSLEPADVPPIIDDDRGDMKER
jgi:hypothetical protein